MSSYLRLSDRIFLIDFSVTMRRATVMTTPRTRERASGRRAKRRRSQEEEEEPSRQCTVIMTVAWSIAAGSSLLFMTSTAAPTHSEATEARNHSRHVSDAVDSWHPMAAAPCTSPSTRCIASQTAWVRSGFEVRPMMAMSTYMSARSPGAAVISTHGHGGRRSNECSECCSSARWYRTTPRSCQPHVASPHSVQLALSSDPSIVKRADDSSGGSSSSFTTTAKPFIGECASSRIVFPDTVPKLAVVSARHVSTVTAKPRIICPSVADFSRSTKRYSALSHTEWKVTASTRNDMSTTKSTASSTKKTTVPRSVVAVTSGADVWNALHVLASAIA
mmetsp:Transcript_16327/g.38898  ORF Transcript_16327/g.38898 Transcript_16327/m.38898 type:complete len:333 (+) Transcript_16327:890-1888(+)